MNSHINDPRPYEQYLLTLALLLISAALVYTQAAKRLDLLAYDAAINLLSAPADEHTVIISIDEKSLNGIGQWPWRRAIHAQLIEKLTDYNAALVAFDIIFSERDTAHPEDDLALARAIKANGHVLLPLHIHPLSDGHTLSEILPIPVLVEAAKGMGHVHVELDEDGLARGLYLNSGVGDDHWPSLSMAMAIETNPMARYLKQVEDQHAAPYVSVNTEYRLIPFAGPGGTYPTYSYLDVMLDKVPAETFRDKTVLVGASAAGLGDIIPTPVSRLNQPMSGVELHANAYSAIMKQTAIRPVAAIWSYLLTFAFIMIPILVFPRLKPTHVMPFTMLLVVTVVGFSFLLIRYDQSWFPPINAVIGILLSYPLWSWQRMRHLNSFLSNELERLNREPDLGFRNIGQHPVEKVFLSLLALLHPRSYVFIQNGQMLHSFDTEQLGSKTLFEFGVWTHDDHSSWLKLKRGKDKYKIGLGWADTSQRESTIEFLDKLDLDAQHVRKPKRYYEQIANRIAQVREAINTMQDMRIFISKGFEEIPGAVMVTDPVGIVVYCNSHAEEWLETQDMVLVGRSVQEIFGTLEVDHDLINDSIVAALVKGEQREFEVRIGKRDIVVHSLPFLVDSDSDAGLMLNLSDITKIREQQREKNQLIDFLSHDVRSPLVSQLAMLHGLRTGRIEWHPELIGDIEKHAKRSLNLSEQFLQITRAEQTAESDFYEFDLLNTIENSLDSLSQQASEKRIELKLLDEQEAWMQGNAELIERAITNVISNAIKYSESDTEISIAIKLLNDRVQVSITDQGPGIDEKELPFIFNRFRRQKSSEVSGQHGTGLGLNFVKVVVDKHHGEIDVESAIGAGTTFTLKFPKLD